MARLENLLKIPLQDVLKMSWRHLNDVFKASWRRLEDALKRSWRHLEDVLKMSWRRFEDIWQRRIYWSWPRRLEDVLKMSSEDVRLRRTYSSWSRRLLKTKTKDVFIKTNVCWGNFIRARLHLFWKSSVKGCFSKSPSQWQISRREVISVFVFFILLNLLVF